MIPTFLLRVYHTQSILYIIFCNLFVYKWEHFPYQYLECSLIILPSFILSYFGNFL